MYLVGRLIRFFQRCYDCGSLFCPVMTFADEEREHRWWCGK
jgi:hypothetical protein